MKVEDVRKLLAEAVDDDESMVIPTSVLAKLKLDHVRTPGIPCRIRV